MTFDIIVQRAIARIAFNYAAKVLGGDFMRHECFDTTRHFIRNAETPTGYQVTTPIFRPILADDALRERQTNGHLLIVEWDRTQRVLQARVSLFNELADVVRFCRQYSGIWFEVATGHLFDPFSHQIVALTNSRLVRPVRLLVP